MNASETDLWVFRDGKQKVSGSKAVRELLSSVTALCPTPRDANAQLTALIQAGEIEAALADSGAATANSFAELTETVAALAFGGDPGAVTRVVAQLENRDVPETLVISPAEGFAYYALQPLSYGRFVRKLFKDSGPAAVIGIRSIGTTLSAVVTAALRNDGHRVQRITVRPTGHPYDRRMHFDSAQLSWIANNRARGAAFLVVDEGPGRSGSTFLSVGEALIAAGVARKDVTLLGSREPDISELCARDAAARWNSFRFLVAVPRWHWRFDGHIYAGGGHWRKYLLPRGTEWPACWPQTERLKFISRDWKQLFKFEGMGQLGKQVRERSRILHGAGFGPAMEDDGGGFTSYEFVDGKRLDQTDLDRDVLERIAQYCALRFREFTVPHQSPDRIVDMVRFNVQLEFGEETTFDGVLPGPQQLVLADARMHPHEWICRPDGTLIKVDGTTDGDDHFFPGPTDIAWDIAGTAVEWNLEQDALEFLVDRFQQLTGDKLRRRLPAFTFAYTIARTARFKMAISNVLGTEEEPRVRQAYARYRRLAKRQLPSFSKRSMASDSSRLPALAA